MDGIRPSDIPYRLTRVSLGYAQKAGDTVRSPEARFRVVASDWIAYEYGHDDMLGDSFSWLDHWRRAPYELLAQAFSFEELVRLWSNSVVQSDLADHIEKKEPLLWKLSNSHWQYGCSRNYNLLVNHMNALRRLDLGLPDFEVRLTHTRSINTHGTAEHVQKLYLDASFAMLVYFRGQHVLTVGFAPAREGVLVAQIQLRQKKGNRFLYKFGGHYVDIALGALHRAFGDTLWLVDGKSATTAIRRSYGKEPCTMTPEDEVRIETLYNGPLAGFTRARRKVTCETRTYVRLKAVAVKKAAA